MKYDYNGPLSGVSLKGHGDVMLTPGATVELPEGHLYTNRLIKRGWLTLASAEADSKPTKTTRNKETE
jgi:hypothetical protein